MFNNWLLSLATPLTLPSTCFAVFAAGINTPIWQNFKLPKDVELKVGRGTLSLSWGVASRLRHTTEAMIVLSLQIRKLLTGLPKDIYLQEEYTRQ